MLDLNWRDIFGFSRKLIYSVLAIHTILAPPLFAQEDVIKDVSPGPYAKQKTRSVEPWVRDLIIYQVWLKSYGQEKAFNNLEKRLEHIAKLGPNMIQLSPVHPHTGGSPYTIEDYNAINPAYGTEKDFRDLIERAHQLGMKVIMDVVFVHTSPKNVLLKEHPEWYLRDAKGNLEKSQWQIPRLDISKPEVRHYLIENMVKWVAKFNVDGFRADVASGLSREFWDEARSALEKTNPHIFMLAEATTPELMVSAFDATYGVFHMWKLFKVLGYGAPAAEIRDQWNHDLASFPRGTIFLRTLDNHDQRRAITEFGNRASIAAMAINLTMDGIPFIYNGQEFGDPNIISVNYYYPLFWNQERTATAKVEGKVVFRGGYFAQNLPIYTKLIQIRKTNPELTKGHLQWLQNSNEESIVSYLRSRDAQQVLVVVNLSNRPWTGTVKLPQPLFRPIDLFNSASTKQPSLTGDTPLSLGPFEFLIAKGSTSQTQD